MTQMIDLFHSLSDHKQQLHFAVLSSALSTEHPTHHCFTAQWQLCVQKKLHEWSTIHPGLLPTTISFCWWKVAESSQARVACKKHILSETLSLPPQHCPHQCNESCHGMWFVTWVSNDQRPDVLTTGVTRLHWTGVWWYILVTIHITNQFVQPPILNKPNQTYSWSSYTSVRTGRRSLWLAF